MEKSDNLMDPDCKMCLCPSLFDEFLQNSVLLKLKKGEVLIESGSRNPHVYIIKDGIIRKTYMDGDKERTRAFAIRGNMLIDWFSHYGEIPAYYQWVACCKSQVYKIEGRYYDYMVNKYHEFAIYALTYIQCQMFYAEKRDSIVNGTAYERYEALLDKRPDIIRKVPLRHIASYLGVSPEYLSRVKSRILRKNKENSDIG